MPDDRLYDDADVEQVAAAVHQACLDTCSRLGLAVKPANQVPYDQLSEDSKELDRPTARAVLETLTAAGSPLLARHRAQVAEQIARYFDGWSKAAGAVSADAMVESWAEAARLAREVGGQVDAPNSAPDGPNQPRTEDVRAPCPEGFHWIGQALTACDQCGLPAWEHAGMAKLARPSAGPFDAPKWVLEPWKLGEREACRRKWDPGYVARSGEAVDGG